MANEELPSGADNVLLEEISDDCLSMDLSRIKSTEDSGGCACCRSAAARHWRSRSAPDGTVNSANWEISPDKATQPGKEISQESGKQLSHQNSYCRKRHLQLTDRRVALEQEVAQTWQVTQLQMRLQDERSVRQDLERAMGRGSNALSPGHRQFAGQTMELIDEIGMLEEEVSDLEQRLLGLYRRVFNRCIASSPSIRNPKTVSSASLENEDKRQHSTLSRVLFTPSKSPSSLNRRHISTATNGSQRANMQLSFKSSHVSLSSGASSMKEQSHSLQPQNDPRMEQECKELLFIKQNNAMPLTLKDYFYKSPNRLSEELVRCMTAIYCKVSDPPLTQSGTVLSPSSSVSSTSISSPHDTISDGWSPRWKTESFCDTPLKDPYKVKDETGDTGPYTSMVEIPWICVDKERLTYATRMLRTFRSMVEHLEKVDPSQMKRDAKLAFWINVYNALVMHAYLAYGIPRNNFRRMSLFQRAAYKVGGHSISASSIEHSILCCRTSRPAQWLQTLLSTGARFKEGEERRIFGRTFGLDDPEPLVCFALCSGGISDPAVRVYTEKNVYNELETAKKEFLQASIGIHNNKKVFLPKLLEWYAKEASIGSGSLLDWVSQNVDEKHQEAIQKSVEKKPHKASSHCIEWLQYNGSFRYIFARDLAVRLV